MPENESRVEILGLTPSDRKPVIRAVSITYLNTDCLNIEIHSGSGRSNERANIFKTKCTFCGVTHNFAGKY